MLKKVIESTWNSDLAGHPVFLFKSHKPTTNPHSFACSHSLLFCLLIIKMPERIYVTECQAYLVLSPLWVRGVWYGYIFCAVRQQMRREPSPIPENSTARCPPAVCVRLQAPGPCACASPSTLPTEADAWQTQPKYWILASLPGNRWRQPGSVIEAPIEIDAKWRGWGWARSPLLC